MRDFDEWLSKFRASISSYDYYIDFEKVVKNVEEIKVELNILNTLIGSKNIEEDFEKIMTKYPEGYEEDKVYDSEEIALRMAYSEQEPDNVYYRKLKEKSVYASFDDIVRFACEKYSLGEIHNFSMYTDHWGNSVIQYEENKYVVKEAEIKQLEREHITESVYCNEYRYCSLSWFYSGIGYELVETITTRQITAS